MNTQSLSLERRRPAWLRPVLGIVALLAGIVALSWILLEGLFAVL